MGAWEEVEAVLGLNARSPLRAVLPRGSLVSLCVQLGNESGSVGCTAQGCIYSVAEHGPGSAQCLSATTITALLVLILGFPGGSVIKNLPASTGDAGSTPGL